MKKGILVLGCLGLFLLAGCKNNNVASSSIAESSSQVPSSSVEASSSTTSISSSSNIYSEDKEWAIKEIDKNKDVDTFFIAPTATTGDENTLVIDYNNEVHLSKFLGCSKMEKGIYDENTRFFAPYYHQILMYTYTIDEARKNELLNKAYDDVKNAFEYYLNNYNNGNKIIIAGFSQGGDLVLRLLKDYINNDSFYNKFLACYALGSLVDDNYLNSNSRLKFASGETDTKVIISFNSEDPSVTESFVVPQNAKSYSINPLNWKRDTTEAPNTLNKGAVFLNGYGNVKSTADNFCGAYIDSTRGTLKVTGVDGTKYPTKSGFIGEGVYHTYDYQFFYNNLKENVNKRIEAASL